MAGNVLHQVLHIALDITVRVVGSLDLAILSELVKKILHTFDDREVVKSALIVGHGVDSNANKLSDGWLALLKQVFFFSPPFLEFPDVDSRLTSFPIGISLGGFIEPGADLFRRERNTPRCDSGLEFGLSDHPVSVRVSHAKENKAQVVLGEAIPVGDIHVGFLELLKGQLVITLPNPLVVSLLVDDDYPIAASHGFIDIVSLGDKVIKAPIVVVSILLESSNHLVHGVGELGGRYGHIVVLVVQLECQHHDVLDAWVDFIRVICSSA